ncbi:MAG: alpha/beta hydrolase [Flavobacterium sp.]|nr:MAG: alpha/beta hydrolase [Flavobacterium sp.]
MIATFNNSSIHYTITGKGPALVLLHGFLLSPTIWTEIIPKLAKKNQVITIDLPGHGKSECVAEIHSMELMAEVVNSILVENNIEKTNFIGHSMGGYISLAFAEKYPDKINKLVLLNSSSEADSEERKINRNRAIKVIENNSEIFIKMGIAALFTEERQGKFQHLIEKLSEEAFKFPVEGIIASIEGMKIRKDRTSVLKNFKGEKYMISGVEDPIIPITNSEKVVSLTNTKLYKVQSGHMSINENIDEIVKIMYFIDFI